MKKDPILVAFRDKKVLVIGGGGFVGQNMIGMLSKAEARVTILNRERDPAVRNAKYVAGDVRDYAGLKKVIKNTDIVVNLAAIRPIDSMVRPVEDLEVTCKGALNILECCRSLGQECKVVFFGSSLEYGETVSPVSESNNRHVPDTFYGLHKMLVSNYVRLYSKLHSIDCVYLRFSNIYGAETGTSEKMSVVNLFIKNALRGKEITVYGDGLQIRDYIYVNDAIDAVAKAVLQKDVSGETFNIGSGIPVKLIDMAREVVKIAGNGRIVKAAWPSGYPIGDRNYYADITKARRILGWEPKTSLDKGIKLTIARLKQLRDDEKQ